MTLPRCITLVGPSGSGITTISKELESMGYEIIKPTLLKTLENDDKRTNPHAYIPKIWDVLEHGIELENIHQYAEKLAQETQKCKGNITIFLDADIPILTQRQEENRLKTKLSMEYNIPHQQALNMEHEVLKPFSKIAQIKLDTTNLKPLYARRVINLLLNLGIPFETNSYTKLLDHVVSDFFKLFENVNFIKEVLAQEEAAEDFSNNFDFYKNQLDGDKIRATNGKIFLVGEGSSLMALESSAWLLHKGYQEIFNFFRIPASDLRFTDIRNAIVILCSNSGNTAEVKQNIDNGCFDEAGYVIGITNNTDSALGAYCKDRWPLFDMNVTKEIAIAATVSVFKSILISSAALAGISEIQNGNSEIYNKIFEDVSRLPTLLKNLFSHNRIDSIYYAATILSKNLNENRHGYITSAGMLASAILPEASLKSKELARLHLEGVPNSLFHGPLNPDVARAIYLQDPLVNIKSMKQHVSKMGIYIPNLITIGPNNLGFPNIYIPHTTPINSLLLHLVSLQLIYFMVGLRSGFSLEEIQHPIRLSKVVLKSPLV